MERSEILLLEVVGSSLSAVFLRRYIAVGEARRGEAVASLSFHYFITVFVLHFTEPVF